MEGDRPTDPVRQVVGSWAGWPNDVVDRLRAWNKAYLLSFQRGPDFLCGDCGRWIKAHPNGNAVVRGEKKARGVVRCEDCLVRMARRHETPPFMRPPRLETRLRLHIDRIEKKNSRLHEQLRVDQIYMDRLEEEIPADTLAAIRDELRGRYRRP